MTNPTWERFHVRYACEDDCLKGYSLGKHLGSGESGSVYMTRGESGEHYAMKIVPLGIPINSDNRCKPRKGESTISRRREDRSGRMRSCRVEKIEDFKRELMNTKKLSRVGVGPKFIEGWIVEGGFNSLEQHAPARQNRFPVGVMILEKWDCTLSSFVRKNGVMSDDDYFTLEERLRRDIKAMDNIRWYQFDMVKGNVMVRLDASGRHITDATFSDFGMVEPWKSGKNTKVMKELMRSLD